MPYLLIANARVLMLDRRTAIDLVELLTSFLLVELHL